MAARLSKVEEVVNMKKLSNERNYLNGKLKKAHDYCTLKALAPP